MIRDLPEMPSLRAGAITARPWRLGDARAVRLAGTDPYIVATTSVPADGAETDAVAFIERQWSRFDTGTGYSFALADGHDVAVGQVGLWLAERTAGRAELGYWTVPSRRGEGVARHGLGMVSDWTQEVLGLARLQVFIEPWNGASMKTAARCGYVCEGLLRSWREVAGERRDFLVYSRVSEGEPGPPSRAA